MKTFIVDVWAKIFAALSYISTFFIIRKILPCLSGSYVFVEVWIILNTSLAIILPFLQRLELISGIALKILLLYGGIRVFEMVIYQINVLLFDQYRSEKNSKSYKVRSYRRLVILSLQNYVEILFWFTSFYIWGNQWFSDPLLLNSVLGSFYYSLVTMSTLGYGDITPEKAQGFLIVIFQISVGLFMALMIIARFLSLLTKPESMDDFEVANEQSES